MKDRTKIYLYFKDFKNTDFNQACENKISFYISLLLFHLLHLASPLKTFGPYFILMLLTFE